MSDGKAKRDQTDMETRQRDTGRDETDKKDRRGERINRKRENRHGSSEPTEEEWGRRDRDGGGEGKKMYVSALHLSKFYFGDPAPWNPHPTSPPPCIAGAPQSFPIAHPRELPTAL